MHNKFAEMLRIAEIQRNIQRYNDVQAATTTHEIIETEAMVNGEAVVMVQCGERGVYETRAHIDAGLTTMDEMYRAVTE